MIGEGNDIFLPVKCKRYSVRLFYIFGWKCWLNRIHLRWWWLGRTVISLSLSALSGAGFVLTFCIWTSGKNWKSPDSFRLSFLFWFCQIMNKTIMSHFLISIEEIQKCCLWFEFHQIMNISILSYFLIFIWENEKKSWSTMLLLIRPF